MGLYPQVTSTGDTLVASQSVANAAQKRQAATDASNLPPTLLGVQVPEPVFFCSVGKEETAPRSLYT